MRTAILSLVLTLRLAGSLEAEEVSAAAHDPEGARQAKILREGFEAARLNPEDPTFLQLFDSSPNLTRRAFLPLLELSRSQSSADLAKLCAVVADLSLRRFGDHIPNLILKTVELKNPDASDLQKRYTSFLWENARSGPELPAWKVKGYEPYSDSYTLVDRGVDYSQAEMAAAGLYHTKGLRFKTAFALGNLPQVALERETYSQIQARLETLGKSEPSAAELARVLGNNFFQDEAVRFYERRLELESGLIDKIMPDLNQLNDSPHYFSWKAATLYVSCAWAAAEQARLPILEEMLSKARDEMNDDPEVSKDHAVLRYVIATLDYRLKRLRGYDPDEAEVIAEFQKAFVPLETYHAMFRPNVDVTWVEGRPATRFWLDELARFPASGQQISALLAIDNSWSRWYDEALQKQLPTDSREDRILKWAYVDAIYSMPPSYLDQLTYRLVKFPQYSPTREELEGIKTELGMLPLTIEWMIEGQKGEGFPTYDLSAAGLIPEMQARLMLVESRLTDMTSTQRSALLERSIPLARAAGRPSGLADHLLLVGLEFQKLERPDRAVGCWLEVEKLTDKVPLVEPAFKADFLLAREYFERKDWEKAAHYAELAMQKLEVVSPLIGTRSSEARRWSQELETITSLIAQAHIAADSPEKAMAALARGSQLQAAALQVEGSMAVKQDAQDLRLQQQEVVAVTEQVARLEAQPASPMRDGLLAETRELLADSEAQYLLQGRALRQKHAALYSKALKFDPLDLPALQGQLPSDVAVLQFFPTEKNLYTFLVTRDSFRLRATPIGEKELDALVVTFMRGLRRNINGDAQVARQSQQLYDTLVGPFAQDFAGKSSLVLIPTGRLHALPFACLSDSQDRPLIEKMSLIQLARPSDLSRLSPSKSAPIDSVVAFANASGDLPAAQVEGKKIVSMFPKGKLFETRDATRANLFSFGDGAQVLHLATHGEWNLDDSLQNYLLLAGSEKVAQEEIFQLSLEHTSLVILSACNTAMGEGGEGGYVASLAEAFWLAGSHSVVASLWAVDDRSTSLLMETFYQRLQAGDDKAEALRAAQLAVRSVKGFEHPYYWAGFLLFGERG